MKRAGTTTTETPMMQQYLSIKARHQDAILFFRMGDFYEMFFDDAKVASHLLDLTLTSRDKGKQDPVPMAGLPYHAARGYVRKLLRAGHKVAICEQVEDPKQATGLVRREVTRVITPGVNLEELEAREHNYLCAVSQGPDGFGVASLDVSTGDFGATVVETPESVMTELHGLEPQEILVCDGGPDLPLEDVGFLTTVSPALFDVQVSRCLLEDRGLLADGSSANQTVLACAGAVVSYVLQTQKDIGAHIQQLSLYDTKHHMILGPETRANLELHKSLADGSRQASLLGIIDRTSTAMGGRLLRQWLDYPLLDPRPIARRLDAVEELYHFRSGREGVRQCLKRVGDLERLCGRIASRAATPRDLRQLARSLRVVPEVTAQLTAVTAEALRQIARQLDSLEDVASLVESAIVEDPPANLRDGGYIRPDFDPQLQQLVSIARDGKSWLLDYEATQRQATGISSLKVKYNKVFGYYIEVSKARLDAVPDHYIRRQTLTNCERFATTELKEYESKVLTAEDERIELEQRIFEEIVGRVSSQSRRTMRTARGLAELDVYNGMAELAEVERYSRPEVDTSLVIDIVAGRHPVVEAFLPAGEFIPNDVHLESDTDQLLVITGPNMAGKSTILRTTALVVLLAQMGSFVPASQARIGVVDRIFTRVGASDNLARGQSTFMIEMTEAAIILGEATPRSLIILDEVGRGTSTFDGLSIAWSVAEHIHDVIGARTLFATHYHELTELEKTRARVKNYTVAVRQWEDEIIFLRKLLPGGVSRSYGIQVARLAGLPEEVLDRAKQILRNLEAQQEGKVDSPALAQTEQEPSRTGQLLLFGSPQQPRPSDMEQRLARLNLDRMTPIQALNLLHKLQKQIKDG